MSQTPSVLLTSAFSHQKAAKVTISDYTNKLDFQTFTASKLVSIFINLAST